MKRRTLLKTAILAIPGVGWLAKQAKAASEPKSQWSVKWFASKTGPVVCRDPLVDEMFDRFGGIEGYCKEWNKQAKLAGLAPTRIT